MAKINDWPEYLGDDPEWYATLERPPIFVTNETSPSDLINEIEERLSALLNYYACDPTPTGWRRLALTLLMKHEPVLQLDTPVERGLKKNGPDPSDESWINLIVLNGLKKQHGSYDKAADVLARQLNRGRKEEKKIKPQSLKNLPSLAKNGRILPPSSWRRAKCDGTASAALWEAAKRLEKSKR